VCNSNGLHFQKLTRMSLSSFVLSFLLIITVLIIPLLQNAIASEDIFGIEKIYPTKKGGEEWYIDMINPLSNNRLILIIYLQWKIEILKIHHYLR
jgi:hypothetical protein